MSTEALDLNKAVSPASEALVALMPVARDTHLGGAILFFLYDTPKVLMLLTGVVFAMGMVNEVALTLLFGMFGWKIALLYTGLGLRVAIVAGWIIGRLRMEAYLEDWVREIPTISSRYEDSGLSMGEEAWWSVPLAVLVGIPLYSNAAGVIPVVQALLAKVVPSREKIELWLNA